MSTMYDYEDYIDAWLRKEAAELHAQQKLYSHAGNVTKPQYTPGLEDHCSGSECHSSSTQETQVAQGQYSDPLSHQQANLSHPSGVLDQHRNHMSQHLSHSGQQSPGQDPRGMDNLDYILTKLESRSVADGWPSNDRYYSQSSLLPGSKGRCPPCCTCCGWRCYCKVAIIVLVLLLVAWGVAVPLYFIVGPNKLPWDAAKEAFPVPLAQTQASSLTNGTVLTAVNCSVRIVNQRYSHHLSNPYSADYQSMKLRLETLLTMIFQKDEDFNKPAVTGFRPGSVVVQFVLLFSKKRPDIRDYTHSVLTSYLFEHWHSLGSYQVESNSITVNYIQNQCAVDNGGCSHLCFWSLLSVGYECHCPQRYSLLTDGKTCYPATVGKTTTTVNPCGDSSFLCGSGNCIPKDWLCDGVSDCLLGEDEASHTCDGNNHSKAELFPAPTSPQTLPTLPTSTTTPSQPEGDMLHGVATPRIIWHDKDATTLTADLSVPNIGLIDNGSKLGTDGKPIKPKHRFKFMGK